jgi:hypothetical protein
MINTGKQKFLCLYIDGQLLIEEVKCKKMIIKLAFIGGYNCNTTDFKIINKIKNIYNTIRPVVRVINLVNAKKFKATEGNAINAKTQCGHLSLYQFLFYFL